MKNTAVMIDQILSKLKCELPGSYSYHSAAHTLRVLEDLRRMMALEEDLSEEDREVLLLAGALHDIGYVAGPAGHEKSSAAIGRRILEQFGVAEEQIRKVEALILSTCYPPSPENRLEEIICDADISTAGGRDFGDWEKLLRRELSEQDNMQMTDCDWYRFELDFLTRAQFRSPSGRMLFEKNRLNNIMELEQMLKERCER